MKQYLTLKEAAKEFGCSEQTISKRVKEMRELFPARYGSINFYGSGKKLAVRTACLFDFDKYGDLLKDMPEFVPPFNPLEYEAELGITENPIQDTLTAMDIALEVVKLLRSK